MKTVKDWLNGEGDATTEEDLRGGRNGREFEGTFEPIVRCVRESGRCVPFEVREIPQTPSNRFDFPFRGNDLLPIRWHVLLIHLNCLVLFLLRYVYVQAQN
jgi:hypothetical protein